MSVCLDLFKESVSSRSLLSWVASLSMQFISFFWHITSFKCYCALMSCLSSNKCPFKWKRWSTWFHLCAEQIVCVYLCMYARFMHTTTQESLCKAFIRIHHMLWFAPPHPHTHTNTHTHTYDFLLPASHIHSLDVQWKIDVGLSSCQRTLAKAERVQEQMHQPEMTINNAVSSRLRESVEEEMDSYVEEHLY